MTPRRETRPADRGKSRFDFGAAATFAGDGLIRDREWLARRDGLLHLMQTGCHVVIIEGEPETGRTTLLQSLVDDRDGLIMPLPIPAADAVDEESLANACIQGFDLPYPPTPSGPRVVEHAGSRLSRLVADGRRPVVMIDDVDDLPGPVLPALLHYRLASRQDDGPALGLVLTGRRGLAGRVREAAGDGLLAAELHVVILQPWSENRIAAFIRRELGTEVAEAAMKTRLPPSAIRAETGGLPGRVREACRRRWLDETLEPVRRPVETRPPRGLPSRQPLILGSGLAAAAVLGLGLFLLLGGRDSEPEEVAIQRPSPDSTELTLPADPDTARGSTDIALPGDSALRQRIDGELALAREAPATDSRVPAEMPGSVIVPDLTAETEPEPEPEPAPAPAPEPEPEPEPEPQPEPEPEPEPEEHAPSVAGETTGPTTGAQGWLAAQPAEHYTVQVMAARQREALERQVTAEFPDLEARVVGTRRNGEVWFVAIVGSYAGQDAARATLNTLPQALRDQGAWIRTIGSLR